MSKQRSGQLKMQYIYLDNNATTPCDEVVVNAMLPYLSKHFGNPASPHALGKEAHLAISRARDTVAQLVGSKPHEIVFTSGATESNNIVIMGLSPLDSCRSRIVTSAVEHKSILNPCSRKIRSGFDVREIEVDHDGLVNLYHAQEVIDEKTALVSVQAANNETGVLQPVEELAELAHSCGALFHCDAAQWFGKLPPGAWFEKCDYLSISGHKFYGPKGVGALLLRSGNPLRSVSPVLLGGGQEGGLRPGTLNVPGIVGLGVACELARTNAGKDVNDIEGLRNYLETTVVTAIPGAWINGAGVRRLPGTCSLTIPEVPASVLISNLSPLCISEGSACTSGAPEPSHVLRAMGLSREEADCTVRISLGKNNSKEEIEYAADKVIRTYKVIIDHVNS